MFCCIEVACLRQSTIAFSPQRIASMKHFRIPGRVIIDFFDACGSVRGEDATKCIHRIHISQRTWAGIVPGIVAPCGTVKFSYRNDQSVEACVSVHFYRIFLPPYLRCPAFTYSSADLRTPIFCHCFSNKIRKFSNGWQPCRSARIFCML